MKKQLVIWCLVCLNGTEIVYAQVIENDSLRTGVILLGRDTLRLNQETLRAIEDGTFLNRDNPFDKPLKAPPILPLGKDFRDIEAPEEEELQINPNAFKLPPEGPWKNRYRVGNSPVTVKAGAQNLLEETVRDGQRRGSVGGTVGVEFSLDDILCYLFKRSEWRKRRNKKRAEAVNYHRPPKTNE